MVSGLLINKYALNTYNRKGVLVNTGGNSTEGVIKAFCSQGVHGLQQRGIKYIH